MTETSFLILNHTAEIEQALGLRSLQFFLSENWGSIHDQHREKIREHLQAQTNAQASVLDLNEVPAIPGLGVSISHAPKLGGYALSASSSRIGFDLEETTRIRASSVERIARMKDELSRAPSAAHLWVAKESSYKALSANSEVNKISDLEITNWSSSGEIHRFESFAIRDKSIRAQGVSWQDLQFSYALSVTETIAL